MKMIRTFHPVGQGAFYSEEFFDSEGNCVFRVVYDCGSLKFCGLQRNSDRTPLKRKDIEERVVQAFPDGHGVDILFARNGSIVKIGLRSQFLMINHAMHLQTTHIGGYRIEVRNRLWEIAHQVADGLLAMFP